MSKVGLLGGTFDPFHNGHLAAARAAMECAHLDRVIFIPSAKPPHRPPAIASPEQRLEMCTLAIQHEAKLEVSKIEQKRGGTSYTVDTLKEIRRLQPNDELFLILGWDAARLFETWHEPDRVREMASVVVVARPGSDAPREEDLKPVGLDGRGVTLCLRPTPDISASEIRRAVAAGESITGKVPAAVERYVASHALYAG